VLRSNKFGDPRVRTFAANILVRFSIARLSLVFLRNSRGEEPRLNLTISSPLLCTFSGLAFAAQRQTMFLLHRSFLNIRTAPLTGYFRGTKFLGAGREREQLHEGSRVSFVSLDPVNQAAERNDDWSETVAFIYVMSADPAWTL